MENVIYFMEANIIYVSVCKAPDLLNKFAFEAYYNKSQNLNYEIIPPLHHFILCNICGLMSFARISDTIVSTSLDKNCCVQAPKSHPKI